MDLLLISLHQKLPRKPSENHSAPRRTRALDSGLERGDSPAAPPVRDPPARATGAARGARPRRRAPSAGVRAPRGQQPPPRAAAPARRPRRRTRPGPARATRRRRGRPPLLTPWPAIPSSPIPLRPPPAKNPALRARNGCVTGALAGAGAGAGLYRLATWPRPPRDAVLAGRAVPWGFGVVFSGGRWGTAARGPRGEGLGFAGEEGKGDGDKPTREEGTSGQVRGVQWAPSRPIPRRSSVAWRWISRVGRRAFRFA